MQTLRKEAEILKNSKLRIKGKQSSDDWSYSFKYYISGAGSPKCGMPSY